MIFGSGFSSSNLLANFAALAWLFAFANALIALRKASWSCCGSSLQCVKYAASSSARCGLLGSASFMRRCSSSMETPRRYSRAEVTSARHYPSRGDVS